MDPSRASAGGWCHFWCTCRPGRLIYAVHVTHAYGGGWGCALLSLSPAWGALVHSMVHHRGNPCALSHILPVDPELIEVAKVFCASDFELI